MYLINTPLKMSNKQGIPISILLYIWSLLTIACSIQTGIYSYLYPRERIKILKKLILQYWILECTLSKISFDAITLFFPM